jgi:hypothetical protein
MPNYQSPMAQQLALQNQLEKNMYATKAYYDNANDTYKDAQGYVRYKANNQRVNPDVEKPPATGMVRGEDGSWAYDPGYIKGQKDIAEAKSDSTNVTIEGTDPKSPLHGYTESRLEALNENAQTSFRRQQEADIGLELLRARMEAGDDTGKWAPMQTQASAWLGLNSEDVANAQLFDVKMGDRVMARIQETKGAVSEWEMAYFAKISPGSDKEPLTNYILLEIERRAAFREQDKMNYVRDYINDNGDLVGFDQWYMKNHDPFEKFSVDAMKRDFAKFSGQSNELYDEADAIISE